MTVWTPERIATLKTLWAQGLSASHVAQRINHGMISRNAVIGKVYRMGLPRRPTELWMRKKITAKMRVHGSNPGPPEPKAKKVSIVSFQAPVVQLPKIKPDADPIPVETDTPAKLVSLTELSEAACKWPYGASPVLFGCDCKRVPGTPYCAGHMRRASDRRPRAVRQRVELVRDNSLEFA